MKKRFFGILLMGAMVIASMSMFTSCKDYDDDINSVKNDVTALRTELATLKTTLTNDLSTAKSQLESAIAAKASATDLTNLAARVAALETKIAAIDNCASKSDVEALATTIATLTGDITTLQAALAAKANSTDLEAYAKVAALQAAEANIALQQTAITSLQASLESLASKVETLSAAKGDKEAIENLQNKLNSLITDLATAKSTLATATADIATAKSTMNDLSGQVSDAIAELNVLKVLVNNKLTSLVFRPEFYAHGIEAVEVMNLQTPYYDYQDVKKKGTVDELWGLKGSKKTSTSLTALLPNTNTTGDQTYYVYAPLAYADYHINPTTADLKGAKVKFYTNVAYDDFQTRAGYDDLAKPVYSEIGANEISEYVKNGVLTVPFSVIRDQLNAIRYDATTGALTGKEAFVALSLTKTDAKTGVDTTVVSDYALISPADYIIVALEGTWLNRTIPTPHNVADNHLWRNIKAAAKTSAVTDGILYNEGSSNYYSATDAMANYKLDVVYNESIDLAKYVKTHGKTRILQNNSGNVAASWSAERTLTDDELKALGLSYKFEVVHYNSGSNRTDEAKHIELDGSVAYPRSVTNAGEQISGQVATREVIGREPLIRVTLEDADGNVVQHGYILLHISATAPTTNAVAIDFGSDYYMNCTAKATLTWAQVEADILRAVGMSKLEFDATYSLETVPVDGVIAGGKATAVQYVKSNDNWVTVKDYNTAVNDAVNADASLNTPALKNSAAQNAYVYPLGSVYQETNVGAQQTTVLTWEIGSAVDDVVAFTNPVRVGTTNQTQPTSISKAMSASGATVATKGISAKAVSVTVAFKQKDNAGNYIPNNAIYVTLTVPATKLHFAYAEISGKDLSLWYKNNSYLNAANSDESDAAEVHLNVPTPALLAGPLGDTDFKKTLTETFVSNLIGLSGLDDTHFDLFTTTNFSFKLVKPVKGTNATDLNAAKVKLTGEYNTKTDEYPDAWVVNGVTGAKYIVQVNAAGTEINARGWVDPKDKKAYNFATPQNIVTLTIGTSQIEYATNKYAQDILNYSGRLDQAKTDLQTSATEYLGVEDKTFTAFIQIVQNSPCYNLMMPNEYFKVRWLRPINVYSANKEWTDALNTKQEAVVAELVGVNDWRNMAVNGALTGASNVNATFYGIADSTFQHFYVDASAIYTDHHLAVGSRTAIPASNVAAIEALKKTSDIPALANAAYFGVENPTGALTATDRKKAKLYYINTEANVGTFHLYVPVYVAYSFGEWSYNNVLKGAFVPNNANQAPLFTQKVYAVITVKQTTNSSTQARKN